MSRKFIRPLSASVFKTLKANAKKSKLFTFSDLKASFRRGQGAFLSSGSRRGMSMQSWSFARVNKLISRGRSSSFDKDLVRRAVKRKENNQGNKESTEQRRINKS